MTTHRTLLQHLDALGACVTEEGPEQHELDAARQALAALREALAAPEPEPVALDAIYAAWHGAGIDVLGGDWRRFSGMLPPLYAAPPAAPDHFRDVAEKVAPDGWVMVPREPTPEMRRAGVALHQKHTGHLSEVITAVYRAMIAAAPAQPADQWKQAIDDELVCCHIGTTDSFPDAKSALKAVLDWHVKIALDPAVSSDAQALIDRGAAQPVPLTTEQIMQIARKHGTVYTNRHYAESPAVAFSHAGLMAFLAEVGIGGGNG